ncbi:SLATT domain-containing protein [Campylobacter geochelonis]|uniref:SLATT domain-containing protein n=1 Tax=Campylobacter geochelonis TaxID=1780362 RepID=UPI0007709D25|nr:DUF4231 domain-containing protein [Campylobacter geochelonis]CZE50279.1 Uncharacterised protein [Campylobacter geochelonis]
MDEYKILEDSVRNTFGSVVWSHKIQEKQADLYFSQYKFMETAKIVAASLTSVGIVSLLFTDQMWIKILSAIISFISVFISAFLKSFDLQTLVSSHNSSAQKLLAIRDDLKILLLMIRLQQKSVSELTIQYQKANEALHDVYAEASRTTDKAVKKARIALNITQDNVFSNEEINSNLPKTLHRRRENE